MPNYNYLRELITSGWTRQTRNAYKRILGEDEFSLIGEGYKALISECPIRFRGSSHEGDVFLQAIFSDSMKKDFFEKSGVLEKLPKWFTDTQEKKNSVINKVSQFLDNLFPKLKNEEINPENIAKTLEEFNPDDRLIEKEFMQILGYKVESFKISDIIRPKKCNPTATLKRDTSFISEAIETNETQINALTKAFNLDKDAIIKGLSQGRNFTIKHEGKTIGYYSLMTEKDCLNIGNFTILPEYRNSKSAMNALLTLRDSAIETAREQGFKTVRVDVDVKNPQLLGLYQRFGFEPANKYSLNYTNQNGENISEGYYQLQTVLT